MKSKKGGFGLPQLIGTLVLIAGGIFAICVAIMMLSPGTAIAGYTFKAENSEKTYSMVYNGKIYSNEYLNSQSEIIATSIDLNSVDEIVIKASSHDVEVRQPVGNTSIDIGVKTIFSGVFKKNDFPNFISVNSTIADGVLLFELTVPSGIRFNDWGLISVNLPENFFKVDGLNKVYRKMSITCEKKGDVLIGGIVKTTEEVLNNVVLSDLNIETEKGNVELNKLFESQGTSLNIKTEKGVILSKNDINNNKLEIKLDTKSGLIDFSNEEKPTVLNIKQLNIGSTIADVRFDEVNCNVFYYGTSGRFVAKRIKDMTCSDDTVRTNFEIQEIDGQFLLKKGYNSDITIGKITGKLDVVSKNSKINISNSSSDIYVDAQKGSMTFNDCTGYIELSATKASVNLNKNKAAFNIVSERSNVNGQILEIKDYDNKIVSTKGVLNISFAQDLDFALKVKAGKSCNINYASLTESNKDKTYLINEAVEETTKKVLLETTKSINVTNYIPA